jgi:hypothetical protein
MSEYGNKETGEEKVGTNRGTSWGFSLGAALGIVLWITTGNFIFFPIFVGAGLSIGLATGAERDQKAS